VTLTAFSESASPWLRDGVQAPLAERFAPARVPVELDPARTQGRTYYVSAAFHVYGRAADGREFQLADGGLVDWTQALLGNRKERLLISGLGLERLGSLFA
jgi:hypothetical protein